MRDHIFEGHGVEILREGERFFIRYDSGGIVSFIREIEVSEADALKAMRSERDAYEVLLPRTP